MTAGAAGGRRHILRHRAGRAPACRAKRSSTQHRAKAACFGHQLLTVIHGQNYRFYVKK